MDSSESLFSSEILRSLKYNYFVRKYGGKVFLYICTFHLLPEPGKSTKETLIDNNVPLRDFTKQEIKQFDKKPLEDLDITALYKICQALWKKGVNDPGDELISLLTEIKNERNLVSHENLNISEAEFESKLKDFQGMLEKTLEKTKSLFPSKSSEIDELKAEIQDAVPKTLEKIREKYDFSNPKDRQRFEDEMEEYGNELFDMIQKSSEEELLSLNERLYQILPFDWLPQYSTADPGNIMVSLQVEDDQALNKGHHGTKGIIVDHKKIFNIKDPEGKGPEVVIISGDAGSGKTTILCSYAEEWCKKTTDIPELSSFKFLLLMYFRDHDHENFDDYLKSLIPDTVAKFSFHRVRSVVLGSMCLVLCDGYDEADAKSETLFSKMLALSSDNMKFVVTTRPGNAMKITHIVNKTKRSRINLKVSGLQEEDMKLLTEKLIGHLLRDDDVTQQEQMKKELFQKIEEMDTGARDILRTPLYFNLFTLLYIECPDLRDKMSTRTSLYLQLRKHKIKRILDKTGISKESLEAFDALYRKWSLKHYTERKYEWSEADVKSFEDEIEKTFENEKHQQEVLQNLDAIMSSYFSIKNTKKQLEIVKVYCHRHRSEQEFAAAGSICDDISSSGRRPQGENIILHVLQSKGLWDGSDQALLFRELREVISFIPGILYCTERAVLYDIIEVIHELYISYSLSDNDHSALLEPCIETRLDAKVLESLVSQMKRTTLKKRVNFQEPKSLYVLRSLLPELSPKKIDLALTSNVPRHLSQLNEILESIENFDIHTNVWLQIYLRECPELAEQVLHKVDKLGFVIWDDGYEGLESLSPISLLTSAKELKLRYYMEDTQEDRISQVINRTFPTNREEGKNDVWIYINKDLDLKLLVQSLNVQPLRSLHIWRSSSTKTGYVEELKKLCIGKGFSKLHNIL